MNIASNEINFSSDLYGTVLSNDKKSRDIICYVPRLLSGIPGERLTENQISINPTTNKIHGYTDYEPFLIVRNGLKFKTYSDDAKLPEVGSKVELKFIEGNPKLGYWKDHYKGNSNFKPIEEEKYNKLFKFKINGKTIEVSEEDEVNIEINSEKVILLSDGKNKNFKIVIPEEIKHSKLPPENPENGQIWYSTSNNRLYTYHNKKFNKLIEYDDLSYIDEFISTQSKKAIAIDEATNVSKKNIKTGSIVVKGKKDVFYREITSGENIPLEGAFYITDWNLFIINGKIQENFFKVLETDPEEVIISEGNIKTESTQYLSPINGEVEFFETSLGNTFVKYILIPLKDSEGNYHTGDFDLLYDSEIFRSYVFDGDSLYSAKVTESNGVRVFTKLIKLEFVNETISEEIPIFDEEGNESTKTIKMSRPKYGKINIAAINEQTIQFISTEGVDLTNEIVIEKTTRFNQESLDAILNPISTLSIGEDTIESLRTEISMLSERLAKLESQQKI